MANRRDIAGLLTGIPSGGIDPRVGMTPQQMRANAVMGGIEQMGRGMRGMFGGDRRTGQERQQDAVLGKMRADEAREQSRMIAFSKFLANKYPDSGLDKLAEQGIVTPENLNDFLNKQENKGYTQGKRYTIRDSKGNIFAASTSYGKGDGSFGTVYSPLGTTTAEKPIGDIEVLTEEGVSFEEKQQAKIETADQIDNNELFSEARMGAFGAKFEIEDNLIGLNETLALLDSVKTGGPIANVSGSITKFLGTTPADREELEFRLASRVLSNLKSTFGGAITEGEREYLINISANIKKGNKGNRAIIQNLKEIQERAKKRNDLLLNSRNFEEYENTIMGYNFEDITADSQGDETKVRYEDLKQ